MLLLISPCKVITASRSRCALRALRPTIRISKTPSRAYCSQAPLAEQDCAKDEEYFRFTSGRWLWDEAPRMQERYRKFDVSALKTLAADSVGAQRCVSMRKMAEGGSNRIFRLTMDNQKTVIARIPYPNHGSLLHEVASEVATMDFAANVLKIPVPRVLAWDAQSNNAVGTEYILMEEASGTPLRKTWESLDLRPKSNIVDELVSISKKLLSVSFTRYGSLYFSDSSIPGCEAAGISGDLTCQELQDANDRYVIGPVTESSFWHAERREIDAVRGPWSTPADYVKAIATREIRWLSDFADPKTRRQVYGFGPNPAPSDLIALQQKLVAIADGLLPTDERPLVRPTIWHWDLHAPNIFVEGNKITAIIDWQDCWVGPLLLHNLRPRILAFQGESMLRLPPDYPSMTDKEEKDRLCAQVEKSLLLWSFETPLKSHDPALKQIWTLPQRQMIRDAIAFAVNTWESGPVAFREVLIRIQRNWHLFRQDEECPFKFSQDELAAHREEGEGFNETAEFWESISDLVTREGYVANEDYEQALEMFRQLREQGLEVLSDDEKDRFERATRWATR